MTAELATRPFKLVPDKDEDQGPTRLVPRDYQVYASNWLRNKKRAMLTDKAGLGKTLEAAEAADRPALVVAPTYLVDQWAEFLSDQYPDDVVSLAKGGRRKRLKALRRKADWYVVNVQMLRSYEMPSSIKTVIFDEAHHLRNRRAMQSRAAAKLARNPALRIYELTATPIWKNVDDLWMLLHILQPKLFPSYHDFVNLFCTVTEDPWAGIKVIGIKGHMRRELEELLDVLRLGRTYQEVGRALPPIIERNIKLDFPDKLMEQYNDVKHNFRLQLLEDESLIFMSYAAVMHTLRQLTAYPGKVEAVVDILEDTIGGPDPKAVVIFCWYKDHAEMLAKKIKAAGYDGVELITGDVDSDERIRRALRAKVAVATIASLSEGCNLQHARTVIFFEENWPPGSNYQALSRVRRDRNDDGEDLEPVSVYYLHVRKTIDEIIHRITKKREATIKDVMKEVLQ